MKITEKFLTVNPFTRPGRKLAECKAVILHYVGVNGQRANTVWEYFEFVCTKGNIYASSQYIIDLNGDIIHAIPDDEVAYHCGSETLDPESGKIYTNWARKKFGWYALDPVRTSPNNCTIGIEMCIDSQGNFTDETINAAVELVVKLLAENNLSVDDIGHHKLVVGWKNCPMPWVKEPELFEDFKNKVKEKLGILI